jgi:peptide/nickel transport system permease protein
MPTFVRRLAKYLVALVITVLIGGLLGASLLRFAPGYGVDESELDLRRSNESVQAIRNANIDKDDVIIFYARYLGRMAHGDLGVSHSLGQPVLQLVKDRLPETLKSISLGLLLGCTLGFSLAITVVLWRAWIVDTVASLSAGIFLCMPAAVLALLFVLAHAPGRLVIGLIIFPKVFRYSRSLLLRASDLPHVLTARAKGLGTLRVFLWHILPTAGPQLLALLGISVSLALAAAIPVEVLCDLPGIGQLAWKAALGRDLHLLVNLTMLVTLVTIAANSASDLLRQSITTGVV